MGDFKSKLPDLKELGEIGGKLFKDLKNSVSEIITTYKKKRPDMSKGKSTTGTTTKPAKTAKTTSKKAGKSE